jgi:hypothetical protein
VRTGQKWLIAISRGPPSAVLAGSHDRLDGARGVGRQQRLLHAAGRGRQRAEHAAGSERCAGRDFGIEAETRL